MSEYRPLLSLLLVLLAAPGCGRGGGNPDDPDAGATPDANPGDPDGGEPSAVVVCDDPVPPAGSGACEVGGGAGPDLLLRGTVLGQDTVYEHGSVLVHEGAIACVGCDCSGEAGFASAKVIACAGQVISPGLINAHDHMTYSEGAPIDHGTTRYEHRHGWRGSLSTPQNPHGTGATSSGNRWVELRQVLAGTTSMVGSGSATGMVRNLDRVDAADTALGLEEVEFETFPLGDSNETFRAGCGWSYRFTEVEAADFSAFLPHVAEGINDYAAEEFRCQSTSMTGGRDFTEKNAAHIHSIGLHAADYWNMARDRTTMIWSPRSNIDLYGMSAQVALFHRLGGRIALGTDWTYSGSASILRELACADQWNRDYLDGHFTAEDLWRMVTGDAAHATHADGRLGVLAAGAIADISVFAAVAGQHHRAVVEAGNADVLLVLRAGAPLYGESAVIDALDTGCESIDVCGSPRSLCSDWTVGYADLQAAVTGAYPAFFCGPPAGEPTCVPSRPGEYTGALAPGDADGDGIGDAEDLCPAAFDPIRPIDGGAQADDDGDGAGDACDPTPLAIDLDGDTVANSGDNCPFTANQGQTDADSDGKGDVCDACPDLANPDGVCGPVAGADRTILEVQNGTVGAGTAVTIRGVVVTGRTSLEVWVQDPAAGPALSGLRVFKGSSPGVVIGDRVDVAGTVAEYFGETELEDATITKVGTATPIAPAPVTIAQAMTEDYEGVLVQLTDAAMGSSSYDCSADSATCADADLWTVVSGGDTIIVYKRLYPATDWSSHIGQVPVTGVMTWRYDRRRIMPRTSSDLGN